MTKLIKATYENHHLSEKTVRDLKQASCAITQGKTVVFPTETVYGIGANAKSTQAVEKIFLAKGRPMDNPLIVHVNSKEMALELIDDSVKKRGLYGAYGEPFSWFNQLAEAFWPGPLTLIMKKSSVIPPSVTAGLETVALRFPDAPILISLIEQSGCPIAAPSANLSGKPSPTRGSHVIEDLYGRVDFIIQGADAKHGLESTVVDLSGSQVKILRPGIITEGDIREVLGDKAFGENSKLLEEKETPKSPGMKYTHYKPKGRVILYEGSLEKIVEAIEVQATQYREKALKVAVLGTEETKKMYQDNRFLFFSLGTRKDLSTIGNTLFHVLRKCDDHGVDIILAEGVEDKEIGKAIMNRLRKAADSIIKL